MNIFETDFYNLCLNEGQPFYDEIYQLDQKKFNQWVRDNLIEFTSINSFNEVTPSTDIINDFKNLNYIHKFNQCHYSAKAITILNEKFKYITGFVKTTCQINPIITHSFNFNENRIIDFARLEDSEDPFISENINLPHYYFGIEIPRDFILTFKDETLEKYSMKPFLFEWYCENN